MTDNTKRLAVITEKCLDVLSDNDCTLGDAIRVAFAIVGTSATLTKTDTVTALTALATMCVEEILNAEMTKQETN